MDGNNHHKQTSRRKYIAGVGTAIGVGLAGCSGGSSGGTSTSGGSENASSGTTTGTSTDSNTSSDNSAYTFGLPVNGQDIFKRTMRRTTEIYASKAHGSQLITTNARNSGSRQIRQVNNMLNQGIDGLLLNPASTEALASVAEEAANQGVPVYTIDVTTKTDAVNMFTGFGSVRGGRRAGEALISAVKERGGSRLYAIMGDPAVQTISQRKAGFDQAVEEAGGVEIVGSGPGSFSQEETITNMSAFLQNNEVDGIFSTWGGGGNAAVTALERQGALYRRSEEGHVPTVPIDGFPEVLQNIRDGYITSALQQPMPFYGPIAIEYLVKHLKSGSYQGPTAGDTVEKSAIDIQNVGFNGIKPFSQAYWAPASVTSWESDDTAYHPWMKPQSPMITPENVDADYFWGNYINDIS
jgi:ribose transport system substrate-binding protein